MLHLKNLLFLVKEVHSEIFSRINKADDPERSQKHEMFNNLDESNNKIEYLTTDIMISESQPKFLAEKIAELADNRKNSDENWVVTGKGKLRPLDIFGVEVGVMRRRQGLTVKELAIKADIDMNTLFAIEFGVAPLEEVIQNIDAISNAFGESGFHLSRLLLTLILDP